VQKSKADRLEEIPGDVSAAIHPSLVWSIARTPQDQRGGAWLLAVPPDPGVTGQARAFHARQARSSMEQPLVEAVRLRAREPQRLQIEARDEQPVGGGTTRSAGGPDRRNELPRGREHAQRERHLRDDEHAARV
jgi:hypothetical protein